MKKKRLYANVYTGITHNSKKIETTQCLTPGVNPKVHYGVSLTVMYQSDFISYSRRTTLVGDVDNRDWRMRLGRVEGMWEISVPSPQFCCEPKIAL